MGPAVPRLTLPSLSPGLRAKRDIWLFLSAESVWVVWFLVSTCAFEAPFLCQFEEPFLFPGVILITTICFSDWFLLRASGISPLLCGSCCTLRIGSRLLAWREFPRFMVGQTQEHTYTSHLTHHREKGWAVREPLVLHVLWARGDFLPALCCLTDYASWFSQWWVKVTWALSRWSKLQSHPLPPPRHIPFPALVILKVCVWTSVYHCSWEKIMKPRLPSELKGHSVWAVNKPSVTTMEMNLSWQMKANTGWWAQAVWPPPTVDGLFTVFWVYWWSLEQLASREAGLPISDM